MSFRWFFRGAGVCLLTASLALAAWAVRGGDRAQASPDVAPEAPAASRSVFAFGHVDVEQGVAALSPGQPGRVTAVLVREGETVTEGAALLQLDDALAASRLREAEADLAGAEERLAEAKRALPRHALQLSRQKAAIRASTHRVEAARLARDRKQRLGDGKLVAEEDVAVAEALVKELESAVSAEEDKLRELETADPAAPIRAAEIEVRAARARVEQARHLLAECTLTAPADGEVLRILAGPGDRFGPSSRQPALFFCPAGPRIVRAEIEQEFAGRIRAGQEAVVEDDSRTGATWRGRVVRLSDWYTHRRSILLDPLQFNDVRTLECIVEVAEEGRHRLRIGQRVRVKLSTGP